MMPVEVSWKKTPNDFRLDLDQLLKQARSVVICDGGS